MNWEALIVVAIASVTLAGIRQIFRMVREGRVVAANQKQRRNKLPDITVEEILSPDGSERVRIFQRPEGTFGVCLDRAVQGGRGWYPPTSPGTGSVYASAEIAKREIFMTVPWWRAKNERA